MPATLTDFILLDHRVGTRAQKLGDLHVALGFDPSKKDPALQKAIDDAIANGPGSKRDDMMEAAAFAVLDLTDFEKGITRYAGNRDTEMHDPGSMGKLQFMLGAYQLRFDLACLTQENPDIKSPGALFAKAAADWQQRKADASQKKRDVLRSQKPTIETAGDTDVFIDSGRVWMGTFGQVKFENIFDQSAGMPPKFSDGKLSFPTLWCLDEDHNGADRDAIKKLAPDLVLPRSTPVGTLGFMDRLKLMIGWSSNVAAESIVKDLSMVWVHSPSWRARLFEPDRTGGLWIGEDYHQPDGHVWRAPPFGNPPNERNRAASPLALVTLFAAIFKNKVVDAASCAEMAKMLFKESMAKKGSAYDRSKGVVASPKSWTAVDTPGIATKSFIEDALLGPPRKVTGDVEVASKLGIGTLARTAGPDRNSDTAYVKRQVSRGGRTVSAEYVLAILDIPESNNAVIDRIAAAVDAAVLAAH